MPRTATSFPTRLHRLKRAIARLQRRSGQLDRISRKYWRARRIIFLIGAIFSVIALQVGGGSTGLFVVAVFVAVFATVAIFHNKVRDSITQNDLMREIKMLQVSRINLDWDHRIRIILSKQTSI